MTKEEQMQNRLKQEVEHFLGVTMSSKRDFDDLAEHIYRQNNMLVSPSTLRRFWGYQEQGSHSTSVSTLNLLSRFIGYKSWNDFCDDSHATCESSQMLSVGNSLQTKDLEVGKQIIVSWQPNRLIKIEFLGNDTFRVSENQNSKLQVGDTFLCQQMIEGMPLYCENLLRNGCAPMNYIGGKEGGIKFLEV